MSPLGLLQSLFDPQSLQAILQSWGWFAYVLLFAIIFVETGLFIFFLPGDSLLFIAGFVCSIAGSPIDFWVLAPLLCVAAIAGDSIGYAIGKQLGRRIFQFGDPPWPDRWTRSAIWALLVSPGFWFNQKHLLHANRFYEKHGGKTIVYARFVPIVRTFAPVVAGAADMNYSRFIRFNVFGGIGWIFSMMGLGFYFGQLEFVQHNLEKAVLLVIFISILPLLFEFGKPWLQRRKL
jgi:membrane-associated protein